MVDATCAPTAGRADRLAARRAADARPLSRGRADDGAATALGKVIDVSITVPNVSLVYVVPVLVAAARHGLVPSLWVCGLSVLSFNFFFLPPLYEFTIADPANAVALVLFMFVAIAASALAARTRAQTEAARREARTTAELYAFSRKIAGVIELYDLLWIVVTHLARLLNAEVVILMPQGGGRRRSGRRQACLQCRLSTGQRVQRRRSRRGALVVGRRPADRARHRHPARWTLAVRAHPHQPLAPVGVIGVLPLKEGGELSAAERRLLEAVGNQAAVAIERVTLAADIDQARLGAERERLRSAMLTSVSHDLRTPLASIIGALSSLRSYRDRYDAATRDELLGTALSEAERLDRFVGNLLDMTGSMPARLPPSARPSKSAISSRRRCVAPSRC
jgi:two-component system sensor histidine kinase KdpD